MPPISVSKTKIIPPRRRSELLTRKRLLDMLFDALDRKLTLVSAPAGYGKTSLLIDLVHQSELPACWLALDELDREPQRFVAYFIAALMERFPNFGVQSKAVLENMSSFEQDTERLLVTLCNEIYETIQEHFIFVLDDFHLLDGVQSIHNFIDRFIQLVDENCHLVISSRVLTGLTDLPLLVAREQVSGLSFADLAFQPQELQALLAQNDKLQISDEEAEQLIADTEGWITGLQFSGREKFQKASIHPGIDSGAGLFDYLGQQVLDRQPPDLRQFILRTALFEEFDASLCEAVLAPLYPDPQNWQERIKLISRNNLFALPVGADGRWLRYHHLFRDFIRECFKREFPAEAQPILSRLQLAYESMGEWEKAHQICRQLDDMNALAEMIERASTSMLQNSHLTMESWLNELPPSMLRSRPGLLSIRGTISYTKGELREGLDLLNQADQIYRQEGNASGLNLNLVRRATVYRLLGEYSASLQAADEVIKATEASDTMQLLHAEALRLKGLALYRLGNARQAVSFLERSLELQRRFKKSNIPVLLMETGMAYRAMGNWDEARNAYEKALQIWRKEGNLSWQASLLNNLGILHQFLGEYEKAALAFEDGLLCAQRSRNTRLDILISIGLGELFAELEDFEMAGKNYHRASDVLQGMDDHFLFHSLAFSRANLALLQKDVVSALAAIEQVMNTILSGESKYEHGLLDVIHGRISLFKGNHQQAVEEFEQAERRFDEDGRNVESAVARVWRAAAYHQAGKADNVLEIFSTLSADRGKIPNTVLVTIIQAREWFHGFHAQNKIPRSVRDIFSQAERLSGKIPAIRRQLRRQARAVPSPAPHLTIQALGRAVVSIDGRQLTLSDWQTQSVRDLFFYFLAASKPQTKEQIGETLWLDVFEPSKLKLRFKNEIYRLRRAVGQDVILFQDVFYFFNRNLDYEYDVEAFEAFLARAKAAENPQDQVDFFKKAVDLFAGPYLADVYSDWAMFDRERLGRAYLDALVSLADLYLKHAQPEASISICQRAIEYDAGCEDAYQIAMQAYNRLGDGASVTRMYQACRDALNSLFGIPPSKETEELYRRLGK